MTIPEPEILSQNIGDVDIQYLHYNGDGTTIIFMHATGFLPWLWHPIARELAGTYRIIAPYFCDHRRMDPAEGGLSWVQLAEDLCALCTNLQIKSPLLVGHSMGATVMTIANAIHGTTAEKMVLIEPIFLPQNLYNIKLRVEDHPLASKSIKRRNYWRDAQEAKRYLRSKNLFKNWDEEMLDLYIKYGMVEGETGGLELACHPSREAALFMGSGEYDPWPVLPRITCPVLILEGSESENRSYIDLKKAAALFPKGRYLLVEGAGHLIPMEKPREIVKVISDFFGKDV